MLSIKCFKLLERTGLNEFSTCFHSHVTLAILLLFCNFATFPLSLHWHSIGHPAFFYTFGVTSFYSNESANNGENNGENNSAGSGYYPAFTDGHIIPCVLTLLCLSFVWQGKPLSVKPQRKKERVRVGHSTKFPSSSTPCNSLSESLSSNSGSSSGRNKSNTRTKARNISSNIFLVALYVISLSSSSLCHNVFLLPHFSALAILLFTLNGMNSLLTDSLDLASITTHHHEHQE